jgi:bifunctional UDP-N-acetylglucosamine pyrophosphorylase/glucosamine-1-phosphate N-acetyltransferase
MRSTRPKPLHLLCGRPMVVHVLDAVAELEVDRAVVVVGHAAERVSKLVQAQAPESLSIEFVEQRVQRGTGDAVSAALTGFGDDDEDGDILVLPGDTPLLRAPTLAALVRLHRQADAAATVLTAVIDDPHGYGRVVRGKDDRVLRIVEDADADEEERQISEINTSIYCFRRGLLAPALRRLSPENAQGEYYLSDVVEVLAEAGYRVVSLIAPDPMEAAGVNDRAQLAMAEAELRDRTNERWMRRGVTMVDPERTYIDASVDLAPDVTLFPGTILRGETSVGPGAEIGPDTQLVDTQVGERAIVEYSVAQQATIGADARVGPFATLQPGADVPAGTVTGPHYQS